MNSSVTLGTIFYMAEQHGWDGLPFRYSEETLRQQINSLDEDDREGALEIRYRIDQSRLGNKRTELRKHLDFKTGESKGVFDKEIKRRLALNTSQPETLKLVQRHIGDQNLLWMCGSFYKYQNGFWKPVEDMQIQKKILDVCKDFGFKYTKSHIDGVCGLLKADVSVNGDVFDDKMQSFNCLNGEIRFDSTDGGPILHSNVRENYHLSQIPIEYDHEATAPRFQQFLDEVFENCCDIEERKQIVLEFIGYSLLTTCELERFIILIGSGANGKSVLLKVVEKLLGKANVCSIPPSKLDQRFNSSQLHGKLANIVTEVAVGEKIDDAKIKSLVSGELQTAERKGKDHFEFYPYATVWFATNHMPHTRDHSVAFFRRAEIVIFPNTFEGASRDTRLVDRLFDELPGILTLAINAVSSALVRGDFTRCPSSDEAKYRWQIEADQAAAFVEDCCEIDSSSRISFRQLYASYRIWADDQGIKATLSQRSFSERLHNQGFETSKSGSITYKLGIDLRQD